MEKFKKLSKNEMKNVSGGDGYSQCGEWCGGIIPVGYSQGQFTGGMAAPDCEPGDSGSVCSICDFRYSGSDMPGVCRMNTQY